MQKAVIAISIVPLLAACANRPDTPVSLVLNYAETDLGYRNSGALNPGKLFIWDTSANELLDLRSTIDLYVKATTPPTNIEAKDVRGFEVKGGANLPGSAQIAIQTAVARSVTFVARDAVKEDNASIYTSITNEYASLGPSGYTGWRIDDLRNRARYKLLVLLDPTYAREEQVAVDGTISAGGSLKVAAAEVGTISVSLPRQSDSSCAAAGADRATCFINVAVLDVFVKEDGNLAYSPASGVDRSRLPEAFRRL